MCDYGHDIERVGGSGGGGVVKTGENWIETKRDLIGADLVNEISGMLLKGTVNVNSKTPMEPDQLQTYNIYCQTCNGSQNTDSCALQRSLDTHIPIRLPVTLIFIKGSRIFDDRNTHSFLFDLPNGSRKPFPRPQEPATKSP